MRVCGQTPLEFVDYGVNSRFGLLRGVSMGGVVGADEKHGDLRVEAVDFAVAEAPEDVGGGVAAEAEVEGVALLVEGVPGGLEILVGRIGFVVVVGDGVADEEELRVGVGAKGFEDGVVAVGPAGFVEAVHGHDGGARGRCGLLGE